MRSLVALLALVLTVFIGTAWACHIDGYGRAEDPSWWHHIRTLAGVVQDHFFHLAALTKVILTSGVPR